MFWGMLDRDGRGMGRGNGRGRKETYVVEPPKTESRISIAFQGCDWELRNLHP
jgi:hypothetical protein